MALILPELFIFENMHDSAINFSYTDLKNDDCLIIGSKSVTHVIYNTLSIYATILYLKETPHFLLKSE